MTIATRKVLGQDNPGASATALYTVPTATDALVSAIIVCNVATSVKRFRIAIRPGGASLVTKHYLFYDTPISPNSSISVVSGLTLAEGDVITVYGSDSNVVFTVFGQENA